MNFSKRHIGLSDADIAEMLSELGVESIDELIDQTIPKQIRLKKPIDLPKSMNEREYIEHLQAILATNTPFKSYIGRGWNDTICPSAILRDVFENPVWNTPNAPYQPEVSQGRLEALMNFQTMVCELTAMPVANSSLLDEATAAAEAASMMFALRTEEKIAADATILFIDHNLYVPTLAVLNTRCSTQGIVLVQGDYRTFEFTDKVFGAIVQYPNTQGNANDYRCFVAAAHDQCCLVAVASDILSLSILTPPGEWGADIVFGSTQRLGVPLFYGGPSAAYFATREAHRRAMPGMLVLSTTDAHGKDGYTTQNLREGGRVCKSSASQILTATMSSFFALYQGPEGLLDISNRIHFFANFVAKSLWRLGYTLLNTNFFDTLLITPPNDVSAETIGHIALSKGVNFRYYESGSIGISIDQTTTLDDIKVLLRVFSSAVGVNPPAVAEIPCEYHISEQLLRKSSFMKQEVFAKYHSETDLMRYIKRLERFDISLANSMMPIGGYSMKLNSAASLLPVIRPEWCNIHPLAPREQCRGYRTVIERLGWFLNEITGHQATSLQSHSGRTGQYAALKVIRSFYENNDESQRFIVLLAASAQDVNPISVSMCGYQVVTIPCDERGNISLKELKLYLDEHGEQVAALMLTYPSTFGVYNESILDITKAVHQSGAQVYLDGANMNGLVGITSPSAIGVDISLLDLHKTFALPLGGGGASIGAICVGQHLEPFLPHHPFYDGSTLNTVSSAPFGNAALSIIAYGYICMMGADGLRKATECAILSANYLAEKLRDKFGVVYQGRKGRVGNEFILDCRPLKERSGISAHDMAKRMIDYGYHAPITSFPIDDTFLIEPTESESLRSLNSFIEMMNAIHHEVEEVSEGKSDRENNLLRNAPHPQYLVTADQWPYPYTRARAAYPLPWTADNKLWCDIARLRSGCNCKVH